MPGLDVHPPGETGSGAVNQYPKIYWVYTNADHGDTLAGVLQRANLDGITVLSKTDYDGGSLWQICVEH